MSVQAWLKRRDTVACLALHQLLSPLSWLIVAAVYLYAQGIAEAFARGPIHLLSHSSLAHVVLVGGVAGIGYWMGTLDPRAVRMAGFACIAPLILLFSAVVSDGRRFGFQGTIDTYLTGRTQLGLGLLFSASLASSLLYWLGAALGNSIKAERHP